MEGKPLSLATCICIMYTTRFMTGKSLQLVTATQDVSRDASVTHADKLDPLYWPKTLLTNYQNVLRKLVRPGPVSQMPLNLI